MDFSKAPPKSNESAGADFKSHESTTALLKNVRHTLQMQQNQIAVLTTRVNTLQYEYDAMRDCLHAASLVSRDSIQANIHRRRFSRFQRDHPSQHQETMETVVYSQEFAPLLVLRAGLSAAGALYACSKLTRNGIARLMPELLDEFPLTLYAAGGFAKKGPTNSVECFDTCTGEWRDLPSLSVPRKSCATVSMGGYLYVVGGSNGGIWRNESLRSVERLDLRKLSWEHQPSLQKDRSGLAVVAFNGKIYAIGGHENSAECYTPERDSAWVYIPHLIRDRREAGAVTLNGLIYVLGGICGDSRIWESMERFGAENPAWELMPPMRQPRCNFAVAATLGRIFIAGGINSDRLLGDVDCFDPTTRMWSLIATLRIPRSGLRAIGRAGRMFIVGGTTGGAIEVCDVDRLDLRTFQWISLSPLGVSRGSFGLAASYG